MSSVNPGPGAPDAWARAPWHDLVRTGRGEVLLYGLTPPRQTTAPEDVARLAQVTLERLAAIDVDCLVVYDLDDESDRTEVERPFVYSPTIDPSAFLDHLGDWAGPTILYRSVGKYDPAELDEWLRAEERDVSTVFVGASSREKDVLTTLPQAHAAWRRAERETRSRGIPQRSIPLGAVAIPERHQQRGDEHLRMLAKQESGCAFFITQVVYNVTDAKDLVSDYWYACAERDVRPAPVIFTLSVCGSQRTLDFLEWLGVDVPRWLANELIHATDPIVESVDACLDTATELATFCRRIGLPFGFNVESVSTRKVENEATIELARKIRRLLA